MRDLGIHFLWNREKTFFDMMAAASHDHAFTAAGVRQAFLELQKKAIHPGDDFREVLVFADGGLKSKETLFIFFQLAQEMRMPFIIHYFAPYHGHSEVDGHFGAGKTVLRKSAKNGPITNNEQILEAFRSLPSTQVIDLQIPGFSFAVTPMKDQIRKWFEWKLTPEGKVFCRELSGQGAWKEQQMIWKDK